MAKNELLPFANGEDANVLPTQQWEALTDILENGFQSGVARSEQVNRVLAQGAVASYVLGQLIVDQLSKDATLDKDTLYQNLVSALQENAKDVCLPLSGGTMTGGITFPCGGGIEVNKEYPDELTLRANSEQDSLVGAFLALRTKDAKKDGAGSFALGARSTASPEADSVLRGYVDGTLTWRGKTLFPSFNYVSKTKLTLDTTHTMASDGLIFVEAQRQNNVFGQMRVYINGGQMWLSSDYYSYSYGYYFVKKGDSVWVEANDLTIADAYFMPVRY